MSTHSSSGLLEATHEHQRHTTTRRKQFSQRNASSCTRNVLNWDDSIVPTTKSGALLSPASRKKEAGAQQCFNAVPAAAEVIVAPQVAASDPASFTSPAQDPPAANTNLGANTTNDELSTRLDRMEELLKNLACGSNNKSKSKSKDKAKQAKDPIRDTWRKAGRVSELESSCKRKKPVKKSKCKSTDFRRFERERISHMSRQNQRRKDIAIRRAKSPKVKQQIAQGCDKPPFQNYGYANKSPKKGVYGSFMLSHSVCPESMANHPGSQQVTNSVRRIMTTGRYPKRKSKQQRAREQQQAADAALDVKTESVPPSKTQYGKAWTPNNGSTSYVDPIAEQAATSAVDMTEIQAKVNESAQRLAALYEREKVLMDREKELMKREQELATKTSASAKVAWAEEKAVEVEKTAEAPSPVLEPLMAVDCATNRLYRPETHSCRYEDLAWRANPNGPHSGSAYGAQQAYAFPARSSQAEVNWV